VGFLKLATLPEGLVGAVGEGPGPQPLHRCPHVLRQAGQELAQRARPPDTELNKGGRLQVEQVETLVAEEGVLQDDLTHTKLPFYFTFTWTFDIKNLSKA
jgi:hypothetical protein